MDLIMCFAIGATIVARHAGEMFGEISVAMAARMGLGKLASVIHPCPTQAEAIRQCGDAYNRTRLTPTVKKWMGRWLAWQGTRAAAAMNQQKLATRYRTRPPSGT
jgi:Pyridine nucleotide-disulphide oxidoreductase, dimerisation domain